MILMKIHFNKENHLIKNLLADNVKEITMEAVLCELKEADDIEKFDIKDLMKDQQI